MTSCLELAPVVHQSGIGKARLQIRPVGNADCEVSSSRRPGCRNNEIPRRRRSIGASLDAPDCRSPGENLRGLFVQYPLTGDRIGKGGVRGPALSQFNHCRVSS